MPKYKRTWSEEQKKALSEKIKARWALARGDTPADPLSTVPPTEPVAPLSPTPIEVQEQITEHPPTADNADVAELTQRVKQLEGFLRELAARPTQSPQGVQAGPQGLVGTFERYRLEPNYYPDPRERLRVEPRLSRFAFDDNYELAWEVATSQYKTLDGINTKEPRFTLKLIVKVYDNVTNELTNKRFVILKGVFHEDPDDALLIAEREGITVDETNQKAFLDEMRYLRFRDWLLEAFYPTPPPAADNRKEVVIGNKLVELYEVNSSTPESMAPFFAKAPKKF